MAWCPLGPCVLQRSTRRSLDLPMQERKGRGFKYGDPLQSTTCVTVCANIPATYPFPRLPYNLPFPPPPPVKDTC